ncbi:AraC family transcriptional regulator [Paenibacillus sacheonensis]|uniref:Helix-turn-helix domain-containing protein n=1 Tax=Paenibacillus sacheonensis TaxID=742054 RepID=A0A7X4YQ95_9BACL|nr:AraC family transcriptional regulator [Paenibacillus sacheonensis]MBM7566289.1 AraC-like DNA-binding protein [Paenibacillus sacheonensis]NBC70495.1 helix-turn-helix domain-containing protein [Paenibacillus sacheonensis]
MNRRLVREECFHYPAPFETKMGLWLLKAGYQYDFTQQVGPRSVEFYSIHFVAFGKVKFGWNGSSVVLSEGDLFCLFPGSVYTYVEADDSPPVKLMWAAFKGDQMPDVLARVGLASDRPYRNGAFNRTSLDIVHEALDELRASRSDRSFPLMSLAYRLLQSIDPQERDTLAPSSHWLDAVQAYIHLHGTENLTVDDLAAWAGVHRSHFTRSFTRRFGVSPSKYKRRWVMDKAARLLSEDAMNITQAALTLGYSDLFTFSRSFTRHFGITPSAFRERSRKTVDHHDNSIQP